MNILVTGSSGYIGGNLVRYLNEKGHRVFAASRKYSAHSIDGSITGVYLRYDDGESNKELLRGIDVVVHTAGSNAVECLRDPLKSFDFNCCSTMSLATSASVSGVKKFIYLSTTHVYDADPIGTLDETVALTNAHPYAASRAAAEAALRSVSYNSHMKTLIFRVSNCVGLPSEKHCDCWDLVANDLCRQVFLESELTLKSQGTVKRDFIPLSDVVAVVAKGCDIVSNECVEGTYNLSSGKTITLDQLAKCIAAAYAEYSNGMQLGINGVYADGVEKHLPNFTISNKKLLSAGFKVAGNLYEEFYKAMPMLEKWFKK